MSSKDSETKTFAEQFRLALSATLSRSNDASCLPHGSSRRVNNGFVLKSGTTNSIETRFVMNTLLKETLLDAKRPKYEAGLTLLDFAAWRGLEIVDRPLKDTLIRSYLRLKRSCISSPLTEENVNLLVNYADGLSVFDAYARSGENGELLRAAGLEVLSVQQDGTQISKACLGVWRLHKRFVDISTTESPVTAIKKCSAKNLLMHLTATIAGVEVNAAEVLEAFQGTTLFYVGDCIPLPVFADFYALIEKEWKLVDVQEKDSELGSMDRVYVFKRSKRGGTRMPRYTPLQHPIFVRLHLEKAKRGTKDPTLQAMAEARAWWKEHAARGLFHRMTADEIKPAYLAMMMMTQQPGKEDPSRAVLNVPMTLEEELT